MKGMFSSRLLKATIHRASLKKISTSVTSHRRARKALKRVHAKKALVHHCSCKAPKEPFNGGSLCGIGEEIYEDISANIENERENVVHGNQGAQEKEWTVQESPFPKIEKGPIIPASWHAAVQSILKRRLNEQAVVEPWSGQCDLTPIVAICGGKNVGKSTFARYLVNSFLESYSKVGYLDTDVGQPELTPPGCLSLHILHRPICGPTTLEMRSPERCYFFGDISPKSDPESYLRSIMRLYDYFREVYYDHKFKEECDGFKDIQIPLIINTHGWIKGTGYDVLVDILRYTMPTHVVQVLFGIEKKNLPRYRFWEWNAESSSCTELIYINSAIEACNRISRVKFNARELRELRIVSYFRDCFKESLSSASGILDIYSETAKALVKCTPYQVPISEIKVMHLHSQVPSSESPYCVNAQLVGLGESLITGQSCDGMVEVPQPLCAGLGIVRGLDIQKGLYYVITPLDWNKLQKVDTFLHGRVEIPIPLLQAPGYLSPYLCRNLICIEGTGSAAMGSGKKKQLRTREQLLEE